MTLSKLSWRNAKRQARDYLAYFITMVISASLIYAFNGLVTSREIKNLSQLLENLPITVVFASVFVIFIVGWLVHYTMRFILTKRSRELGTYILLGLENGQVARLFFLENLIIGGAALGVGVVLGNLMFQFIRAIVLWLFGTPYSFHFSFSLTAIALTLLYFAFIYMFALLRSQKRIRRMKIHDLIYFDRQNEAETIKMGRNRRRMFAASILCGVSGTLLVMQFFLPLSLVGAALLILFMYGFFLSFSSGIPAYYNKRPKKKYSGTTLLVYRSLASKLTTMGVTMATISLLITATLLSEGAAFQFANLERRNVELVISYDLFIGSSNVTRSFDDYKEYVDSHVDVRDSYEYYVHSMDDDRVMRYLDEKGEEEFFKYYKKDTLLRLSDYNALRKMMGHSEVRLEDDGYLLHCLDYLEPLMTQFDEPLKAGGRVLSPRGIYSESFTQFLWDGNGKYFTIVVPDAVAESYEPVSKLYAVMTREPVSEEAYDGLEEIRAQKFAADKADPSREEPSYDTILSLAEEQRTAASVCAMLVFPLFYLAIVLTMAAATILTIQLLSDVNRYRKQYGLLHSLGMDGGDMLRALRRQFLLYFAMPVLPSLLISTTLLYTMGTDTFDPGIITNPLHLWGILGITLALFFALYLLYAVTAYTSFKRNVL